MRYGHRAPLCKFFGAALTALSLAAAAPARADETPLTIVALGDSLTAGYLLGPDEGFPEVLERALHEAGHENVKVANAGVSGDTTTGGLARLGWALGANADAVIVELGANDALRGVDPAITRENLTEIVSRLKTRGLPVLLAGMYAPPNLGSDYADAFNAIYPALARDEGLVFYPFFLDGVAGERAARRGQSRRDKDRRHKEPDDELAPRRAPPPCVKPTKEIPGDFNGISRTRPYRRQSERHLPRHHDLGPAEHASRRPRADGLCDRRRRQFFRYLGNVCGAAKA